MIIDNGRLEIATANTALDGYGATITTEGEAVAYACQYEQQSQNYGARIEGVNYVAATYLILLEGDMSKELASAENITLFDAYNDEVKKGTAQSVEYLYSVGLTKVIF